MYTRRFQPVYFVIKKQPQFCKYDVPCGWIMYWGTSIFISKVLRFSWFFRDLSKSKKLFEINPSLNIFWPQHGDQCQWYRARPRVARFLVKKIIDAWKPCNLKLMFFSNFRHTTKSCISEVRESRESFSRGLAMFEKQRFLLFFIMF